MNASQTKITLAVAQTFVAGASMVMAVTTGAQTPPTSPTPASPAPQAVEKIVVTGSNIKRVESETSSLVQVISRTDIERTGKQSIAEVLRGITGDNQGTLPTAFSGGFANGAAAVSLCGADPHRADVVFRPSRHLIYSLNTPA
jgi:iron complex outermembrane recepter protein